MSNSETFRARFRFRLQKKLNIVSKEHPFSIGAYDIVLSPQAPNVDICDSEWLVMNATGFSTEDEAKQFAEKLKAACEVSSVATRLGVDSGVNLPTSGFGELIKKQALEGSGIKIRDNVHGVDVFQDDPNIRIVYINATGTVRASPDPFLADLSDLYNVVENSSQQTRDIVLLLNYALMRPEPVAQIIFSFSAVEMLGQNEDWSAAQKQLLDELAIAAKESEIGSELEREEVSAAIQKGMYKLSLRQGVLRLLTSLELEHLKPTWDDLYGKRSTLVHGLAPKPGADYSELAFKTVSLCGHILLKAIAREIKGANRHVNKFYALE
jgi:hypothetical protein